jgi:hypothetical protein
MIRLADLTSKEKGQSKDEFDNLLPRCRLTWQVWPPREAYRIGGKNRWRIMNPIQQTLRALRVSEKEPAEEATAPLLPLAESGPEERRSCRVPVLPDHQPCELKVDAKILAAALINESETGLAVLIDRLDGLEIGKEVELLTDAGPITVQVVYIEKVAPCASSVTKCDTLFQLGVKKTPNSALS